MHMATYLQEKKRKIQSKYHQVANKFESTYGLIHQKVTSKFHRETKDTEVVRFKIFKLLKKSRASIENHVRSEMITTTLFKFPAQKLDNSYKKNIDWTRRRFTGQVIKIVVREGEIVEKLFLTPRGNKISIKISELGLIFRV